MTKEVYLGDGLYASYDGYHLCLRAPRGYDDHEVFLEPAILQEFLSFIEKTFNVKIEVKKVTNDEAKNSETS
jgi:hypothetical protein